MGAEFLGKLWSFFKSRKLAIFLIAALVISFTLGVLIPQAASRPDRFSLWASEHPFWARIAQALSLDEVFTSWWFALISFFFFVNLFACTWDQGARAWRLWKNRTSIKNYPGILAPVVIHAGLIVVVLGGLASAGFKMTGYMTVMEGEVRRELREEYEVLSEAPFFGLIGHRGYGIGLKKQERVLDETGKVSYIKSEIVVLDENKVLLEKTVEAGSPLIYKGLALYEYNAGFAPLVTITGPDGRELYKGFLFMQTLPGPPETTYQRKNFSVPGTSFVLDVRFYPDMVIRGGKVVTRKFSLGTPGMEVSIFQNGQEVVKGIVKKGEKLNFAGNSLSFGEVRQWTGLEVVYDPGAKILFGGCVVTLVGMALL